MTKAKLGKGQDRQRCISYYSHYDHGAPAVLIVDPKTNRLVNDGHTLALRGAGHMTPQALADSLAQLS